MVADPVLDVMWIVDPDLIHIYHKRGCDKNLAGDQYAMCIGAWAETLGSSYEIASLYLDALDNMCRKQNDQYCCEPMFSATSRPALFIHK